MKLKDWIKKNNWNLVYSFIAILSVYYMCIFAKVFTSMFVRFADLFSASVAGELSPTAQLVGICIGLYFWVYLFVRIIDLMKWAVDKIEKKEEE